MATQVIHPVLPQPNESPNMAQLLAGWLRDSEELTTPAPISIRAADGRELTGSLFRPAGAVRGGILIGGATGVPHRFYDRYARWLAKQGYVTLSFDYRGIGASRRYARLADDPARMREWGQYDLPAALERLAEEVPQHRPLALIGHSVGGQMLGLLPNHARLKAAVMVATGIGYWRGMPRLFGLYCLAMMRLVAPLSHAALGYLPSSKTGWGEDLPRGVSADWFNWCMRADYFAELREDKPGAYFDEIRMPVLNLGFTDDPIATPANVEGILRFYPNAQLERRRVQPSEFGKKAVGHLHFFSAKMPEKLWRLPLDWLQSKGL